MSKEIVTTEAKNLAVVDPAPTGGEDILSNDIVIPRLLMMQGLSEFVKERKAQLGDLVRSNPVEVLGNPEKPIDFIPITFNNQWRLSELVGKKWEYRGTEPMNASNQDAPWEFEKDGAQWKRTKAINVYALLPQDIVAERAEMEKVKKGEMPDPDKALVPVMISFRVTSYNAGKDVVTHFAKAKKFGLPGYVSTLKLACVEDKNDDGSFYVFRVSASGKTSAEDQKTAQYWHEILRTSRVQVDADEDEKPAATPAPQKAASGSRY